MGDAPFKHGTDRAVCRDVVCDHLIQGTTLVVGIDGILRKHRVTVATGANEIVGSYAVDSLGIKGDIFTALHHIDADDAAANILRGIKGVAQAGNLHKAAGSPVKTWIVVFVQLNPVDAVLQHGEHIGAAEFECADQVAKGKHGQYVAQANYAFVNIGADTATILQGNIDTSLFQ